MQNSRKQRRPWKRWALLCLVASFSLSTIHAFALPTNLPDPEPNQLRVGLSGDHYINGNVNSSLSDQESGFMGIDVSYNGLYKSDSMQAGVDVDGFLGLGGAGLRYFNPSELYVATAPGNSQFTFGRKLQEWNSLDEYWSLGIYQPRFRWDYLQEKQDGLTGFFWNYSNDQHWLQLMAFASPFFIPEFGAPYNISGGDCKTSSPWFSCPSSTVDLLNQPTDLTINLHVPRTQDVILHAGAGASMRLGEKTGLWFRPSYSYKPINQILLAYTGRLDLSTQVLPADIYTRVLYAETFSADVGYNWANGTTISGSSIWEYPKSDTPPDGWNTQQVGYAFITGGIFGTDIANKGKEATRVEFSYFHRHGGNEPDQGPFADANNGLFEPRYGYSNAFSLGLKSPIITAWAEHFYSTVKYVIDTAHDGNILMSDFFFSPSHRVLLNLGVDILGSKSSGNDDFISRYQRNDRVRGGMYYAF